MDDQEIVRRINSFARWHYQFDLRGHLTPIADPTHIIRHAERKKYFFEPLVRMFGGSLKGKRVLDLACNAGYWSLAAIEAGADYVYGLEGRQMHVDQANLVFEINKVEPKRYRFVTGDIFRTDFTPLGKFDIVLCLGLLYHVSKPVELMEKIVSCNTDTLVIDSSLSLLPGSSFELRRDPLDDPRNAVDYEVVLVPTRKAVLDLVHQFGYQSIILKPQFADYTGSQEYRLRSRRAFICSKQTDLGKVDAPIESERLGGAVVDNLQWAARSTARWIRRQI
jgi:2-polyprenyl-3-methyl-5-hydroxy-6-metoxy-1,4-benzoquinol methylase